MRFRLADKGGTRTGDRGQLIEPSEGAEPLSGAYDVFVSYSRADSEFVRRLQEGLAERGRKVWVDWQAIPPTAEWMDEIFEAIDAADTVVVVLSPESAASKVCSDELAHAIENNKRIVPVVCKEVPPADTAADVAKLNWIFARPTDDLGAALDAVVTAIDTDLEYLRAHTKVLVRGREWDVGGRERSQLLRGRELVAADEWLAGAAGHEPAPTRLHAEYILAARRMAGRSRRLRVEILTAGLVAAVALASFAFIQRSTANDQRRRAEKQTRLAFSKQLAAQSLLQEGTDRELSLMLAAASARTAPTPEAADALRQALEGYPVHVVIRAPALLDDAEYSPDGKWILTTGTYGARISDASTGQQVLAYDTQKRIFGADFSRSGGQIVTTGKDGTAHIWSAETGQTLRVLQRGKLEGKAGVISDAAFDPSGSRVVTTYGDGTVIVWNAETGKKLVTMRGDEKPATAVAFSPDGERVVICSYFGPMRIWDPRTGKQLALIQGIKSGFSGAQFSPDGKSILAPSFDHTVRIFDAGTGKQLVEFDGHTGPVYDAAFSPDGRLVVSGGYDRTVRVWNAKTGESIAVLRGHTGAVRGVHFSPDGTFVISASEDGTARVWNFRGTGASLSFRAADGAVEAAVFSPDGHIIATANRDGTLGIHDAADGLLIRSIRVGGLVWTVDFSGDGTRIAAANQDGIATVWDVRSGKRLTDLHAGSVVWDVAFSPDGTQVATAANDGTATVWDARSGKKLMEFKGGHSAMYGIAFSPDGKSIVTGSHDGSIRIWSLVTDRQPTDIETEGRNQMLTVAFSPDGKTVLGGDLQGLARIWDANSGKQLEVMRGDAQGVWNVSFSPDGERVATASLDGTARVWEAATGAQLDEFQVPSGAVFSSVFDRSGTSVLTSGPDGIVRLFPCELCGSIHDLLGLADARISRSFSSEERTRYGLDEAAA